MPARTTQHVFPSSSQHRPFGLRRRCFVGISGLLLGLLTGVLLSVEHLQRTMIVRTVEQRALAMASRLAAVSAQTLWTFDITLAAQEAHRTSQDPDVLYAMLLDRNGRVVVHQRRSGLSSTITPASSKQQALPISAPRIQRMSAPAGQTAFYDIAIPVSTRSNSQPSGVVRLGVSLGSMQTELRQFRLWLLQLGATGFALGTLAALGVARWITAPLHGLAQATRDAAHAHDTGQPRLPRHRHDEIGLIATHVDRLLQTLHTQRMALTQAEHQLVDRELELARLAHDNDNMLALMASGLFTLDPAGHFTAFNATAEAITGWQYSEVQGHSYHEVFADNLQLVQLLKTSRHHRKPLTALHLEFHRRDGRMVPLSLRTALLHDQQNRMTGLMVVFDDLSPQQRLERRLHRADRLAALGQMAAGIAHEIKNPLASIRTFAQLVNRKHRDEHFLATFDRIVPRELDRINRIIEELLDLTRPVQLHLRPVAITTLLRQMADAHTEYMRQHRIVLRTAFTAPMPPLLADAELLYRCFGNIILNAMEAMPDGGQLTMTCRPVPHALIDFAAPALEAVSETSRVETTALVQYASDTEIIISDTGAGIAEEHLEMVFTPFYTTKPRGTGLGLALTHKLIEEHGGHIHLTSTVGRGTTVIVKLPASPHASDQPAA